MRTSTRCITRVLYYLTPDKGGAKPYALLRQAMDSAKKVAIGRVVLRSKQYIVALRPAGDALCMSTLYFADEVVDQDSLDELPDDMTFDKRELAMAEQLIGALSEKFDPEKYRDEYREKVLELIEKKASGEEIVLQPRTEAAPKVVDLMAALEASIAAARGGKGEAKAEKATPERQKVTAGGGEDEEAKPRKTRPRKSA